jgi:hypothetical protein
MTLLQQTKPHMLNHIIIQACLVAFLLSNPKPAFTEISCKKSPMDPAYLTALLLLDSIKLAIFMWLKRESVTTTWLRSNSSQRVLEYCSVAKRKCAKAKTKFSKMEIGLDGISRHVQWFFEQDRIE